MKQQLTLLAVVRAAFAVCVLCVPLPLSAFANDWGLQAVAFDEASGKAFEVVLENGVETVDISELEALGMYRVTTTSPWEPGEVTFEGPLLADVIAYLGLDAERPLLLRALDGFTAKIPPADWQTGPVLLATREEGKPLSRRMQGPTRIIYPEHDHPPFKDDVYKSRWIWLISTIEQTER